MTTNRFTPHELPSSLNFSRQYKNKIKIYQANTQVGFIEREPNISEEGDLFTVYKLRSNNKPRNVYETFSLADAKLYSNLKLASYK